MKAGDLVEAVDNKYAEELILGKLYTAQEIDSNKMYFIKIGGLYYRRERFKLVCTGAQAAVIDVNILTI